jgi:hypothetical protein
LGLDSSPSITFGQVFEIITPFVFALSSDQSLKCGHTINQTNNLFLLDSSL